MNRFNKPEAYPIRIKPYALVIALIWSAIVTASLAWNIHQIKQGGLDLALIQARDSFMKDVIYRRWNAGHRGVYVQITDKTPPNQYLKVPERDITTHSGIKLTLMNPAYMTRQVHEIAAKEYGIIGHITSLNPIRPANTPDAWEAQALEVFKNGAKYVSSVEELQGNDYMRLMQPLITEKGCLQCHAAQGYKVGDIRGGISVSVPMSPFWAVERSHIRTLSLGHGLLWLLGLVGISFGTRRIGKQIAERNQALEALRESEEKFRSMMEAMRDASYICSPERRIEYMNPRMISSVGRDAVGELCHKAICNSDEKCSWCVFDQIQQGEHAEYELANPKDNRYYSVSNSPIFHTDTSISQLTILRDITDTKTMEAQLQQARKMESIGTIAAGVAHDFNNILYMITGNAKLALEDIPEGHPVHVNLKEIKSAGLRAAGIVKQLLNFSRKADVELRPIGAITVTKDVVKFLRSTIPSSIEIRKHFPDSEITILGDPVQINQVMMNLCMNASQEMEETGGIIEITVDTESLQEGASSNLSDLTSGEYLKITISDTGPGIDPEIIDRIFDPYFTTKDVGKGSGMGLAVVHGIVKNHNGAITVASQPGEGAIFTVYFPISAEKFVKEVKSPDKIPRGDESIIFVDDEASIAKMGGQMLERLGYEVETKTNPVEVLDLFKSNPDQYDLIITDMTMPQMTGVKLSEKLKAVRSDIPIIVCTGHSSLIDEEKAKTIGIEGFAMEPIVLRDIARVVRSVLDKGKGK